MALEQIPKKRSIALGAVSRALGVTVVGIYQYETGTCARIIVEVRNERGRNWLIPIETYNTLLSHTVLARRCTKLTGVSVGPFTRSVWRSITPLLEDAIELVVEMW